MGANVHGFERSKSYGTFTGRLFFDALMRMVTIDIILPVDKPSPAPKDGPYKTLYLLSDITDIQALAEEKGFAVVMPAGENLFYLDYPAIHALYGEFIGKELVEITRRMFPLSKQREDTFLAGLSMDGYGALQNGLKYAQQFGYVAALSAAAVLYGIEQRSNDTEPFFTRRDYAAFVFGDLERVLDSDKNPVWLARKLLEAGNMPPKVYMACGTEDSLLENNRRLQAKLQEAGLSLTYEGGSPPRARMGLLAAADPPHRRVAPAGAQAGDLHLHDQNPAVAGGGFLDDLAAPKIRRAAGRAAGQAGRRAIGIDKQHALPAKGGLPRVLVFDGLIPFVRGKIAPHRPQDEVRV